MTLIDGKQIAAQLKDEIRQEVEHLTRAGFRAPHLAVIIVGHNGGSETYVKNKIRACEQVGFRATKIAFEEDVTQEELLLKVEELNRDADIDGFIVQLPLPAHIDEHQVMQAIDYRKDVDGLHPVNVGNAVLGLPCIHSATPAGILELLRRYNISTQGKHCVVIGRSNIVGKPMANLLMQKSPTGNATVTLCHSYTQHLREICLTADIVIVAVGIPHFLQADMVKEGAVVIDVGITRVEDKAAAKGYRICGDVDFERVAPQCSYITPVPGGVGPMTIASLLRNTLQAYKTNQQL